MPTRLETTVSGYTGTGHNGRNISFQGIDVIECNDEGKIVLLRAFWNPEKVMAELKG